MASPDFAPRAVLPGGRRRAGPGFSARPALPPPPLPLLRLLVPLLLLVGRPTGPVRAGELPATAALTPARPSRWEFGLESAATFGLNNPAHYRVLPQFLTLRWKPFRPWELGGWRLQHQWLLGAAAVSFIHGEEHYYFGLGAGFRLVLTRPGSRFEFFFDLRSYAGFLDSHGPPNGQGEDFTFSPAASAGLTYRVSPHFKVGAAFLYEHFSNAGLSEPEVPNIGLDTIGPKLEFTYVF